MRPKWKQEADSPEAEQNTHQYRYSLYNLLDKMRNPPLYSHAYPFLPRKKCHTSRINARHAISSQRQRSAVLRNTANNGVHKIAALQDRSAVIKIVDQEDFIRLTLKSADERPEALAQRVHCDKHRIAGDVRLEGYKIEERSTHGNVAPARQPQS